MPSNFPSPADDYIDKRLNLNDLLIQHPESTFFVTAEGNSMIGAGIHSGDILIVDRSINAQHGKIAIIALNGELTVKRLIYKNKELYLMPENSRFNPIKITKEMNMEVWGVVTSVIHKL